MFSAATKLLFLLCLALSASAATPGDTILVFGDSLSAGYGMRQDESWPSLLAARLAAEGSRWTVVNASVSGETTDGGLSRLPAILDRVRPGIVILALGANDGLRGLPTGQMQANLRQMIRLAASRRARVLLVGMRLPPNYGPAYAAQFEGAFADLAAREKVAWLPFLLAPIALDRRSFQDDGLHPTAAAQTKLLAPLLSALRPLLK